jgi:hypothetical protein
MNLQQEMPRGDLASPTSVPFLPALLDGMDWETLSSLAYKFRGEEESVPEPLKLAAGGVSFQTQRAINELDREGQPRVEQAVPAWTRGADDKVSREWKERNQQRQDEEGVRMFMGRGLTREQAERAVKRGR